MLATCERATGPSDGVDYYNMPPVDFEHLDDFQPAGQPTFSPGQNFKALLRETHG